MTRSPAPRLTIPPEQPLPSFPASTPGGHVTRRPPGLAREAAQGHGMRVGFPPLGRKLGRKVGKPSENRLYRVGIRLAPTDREIILAQLFRCLGKYDPRAIPRIISKRTGITEQAIDYVLQLTCREFQEWSREIRGALARADEAGAAVWSRRAS